MLGFLTRPVGEPHDGESRHAGLKMCLDLDLARLETDECVGHRAREHGVRVPGRRSHVVTAFPKEELRKRYGV